MSVYCLRTKKKSLATILFVYATVQLLLLYKKDGKKLPEADLKPPELIPHIIHQTWESTIVPPLVAVWMQSWSAHHLHWQQWFWTPEDFRCLLRSRYPQLLPLYERHPRSWQVGGVMRYFILHAFGGVYVDLDVENVQPLDPLLANRSCVLTEEPHEHVFLLHRRRGHAMVMNTIMACRPGHALLEELLANLPNYANTKRSVTTTYSGPFYVDSVVRRYLSSRGVYRSQINDVTVLPAKYLLPTFDLGRVKYMKATCKLFMNDKSLFNVCGSLKQWEHDGKPITPEAYSKPHWHYVDMLEANWKTGSTFHIHDVFFETHHNNTYRIRGCLKVTKRSKLPVRSIVSDTTSKTAS